MCLWVCDVITNRLAMSGVNDSRAFTFTEIINEKCDVSGEV